MSYKYDMFISHASEDKGFVEALAEALRAHRLAVWYDEFELKPGMGLRESIDQGLLSSRFGLVVLSPDFFAKYWPRWELDGLVQLAQSGREPAILPVWHKVEHSDVAAYSPSLANIVAIPSRNDPHHSAHEILGLLSPRPSAVEVARQVLVDFDFPAPILSDDWWLDAAVRSAPTFAEGTFQEASSWGWWGFPLPPPGDSAEAKGQRIAWAAMQHSWQEAAIAQRVTQCAHPDRVLDFIQSQPGLAMAAQSRLDHLLYYVPQLAVPGLGGFLEPAIDSVFNERESTIRADPIHAPPGWILRCEDFCGLTRDELVIRYFWPADPAATSPDASVIAWVDAVAWIASTASQWLPSAVRAQLTQGLTSPLVLRAHAPDGTAETWDIRQSHRWMRVMYGGPRNLTKPDFVREARTVFEERLASSCELLDLPEPSLELVKRISAWGVFDKYWTYQASVTS